MEKIMTIRKHLEFEDLTIRDRVFVYGFCTDAKSLPELVIGVQNMTCQAVKIDYVGQVYIVSADYLDNVSVSDEGEKKCQK